MTDSEPSLARRTPEGSRPPPRRERPTSRRNVIIFCTALAAAAIAGGSTPFGGGGDHVSQQNLDRMHARWNAALRDRVSLPTVDKENLEEAFLSINLPENKKSELETSAREGKITLVWLR